MRVINRGVTHAGLAFLAALVGGVIFTSSACSADPNLLTNGNFENPATPAFTYYDGSDPTVSDDVLGWIMYLNSSVEGSYIQIATESDPAAGGHDSDMGIGPARGGLKTAPGSRVAVGPGTFMKASVTYDNYFTPNTTQYFIDWFDAGGSLLSSTGGSIVDPQPFVYQPYTQLFNVMGFSPAGTAKAGVRFESGDGSYGGLAVDNFTLSLPEPAGISVLLLSGLAILRRRRARA